MAKPAANVSTATDSFAGWITKTNVVLDALTNEIVTVDSSISGANVSGNGSIIGQLSANTLGALKIIGGGVGNTANISSLTIGHANATVSSNLVITGYSVNVTANSLTITSNSTINAASLITNVSSIGVYGNTTIGSNSSHTLILSGTNTYINSTALNIVSNTEFTGSNLSISSANVSINGGDFNVVSNVSISGTVNGSSLAVSSNTNFTGANNFFQNKVSANTIEISSNTYVNSAIIFNSNASAIIQTTGNFEFPGDGTTSNIVNAFEFSEFGSAKFTISASDNDDTTNRLLTEISAVYDYNGVVNSTEYGTIYSDTKFMTFTFSSNATHVRLLGVSNSTVTNTNVTVVRTSFL